MTGSKSTGARERLIIAGLEELNTNGIKEFSLRRVAARCGLSCAAPYKHFENKDALLAAIIEYSNDLWAEEQMRIMRDCPSNPRQQILAFCRSYIRFLVDNPYIRSAIMIKDETFDKHHLNIKSKLSARSRHLVNLYCQEVSMPPEIAEMKIFVVRSLLYGAALLIDFKELPNTQEYIDRVVKVIDREFDLP